MKINLPYISGMTWTLIILAIVDFGFAILDFSMNSWHPNSFSVIAGILCLFASALCGYTAIHKIKRENNIDDFKSLFN